MPYSVLMRFSSAEICELSRATSVRSLPFWIVFVLASVIFLLRSSKKAMSFSRPFWKFSLPIIIQIAPYFVNAYWDFLEGKCS